jgi:hypothetical protein
MGGALQPPASSTSVMHAGTRTPCDCTFQYHICFAEGLSPPPADAGVITVTCQKVEHAGADSSAHGVPRGQIAAQHPKGWAEMHWHRFWHVTSRSSGPHARLPHTASWAPAIACLQSRDFRHIYARLPCTLFWSSRRPVPVCQPTSHKCGAKVVPPRARNTAYKVEISMAAILARCAR